MAERQGFVSYEGRKIDECDPFPNFFECKLENGLIFRINNVLFVYKITLKEQLANNKKVEMKFCLRDDEETKEGPNVENWEMIIFPAFRKDREIPHGTMVSHFDSCVNGNVTVENGSITDWSSNHVLLGYENIQDKVTEFAKLCADCFVKS